MTVTDDGIGIERRRARAGHRPGLGMVTMRERSQAVGGRFSVRQRSPAAAPQIAIEVPHDDHACSSRTITAWWPKACVTSSRRSPTCA